MDHNQDIAVKYSVSSIPVLLYFKGGGEAQETSKMVGVQKEEVIVQELNRILGT